MISTVGWKAYRLKSGEEYSNLRSDARYIPYWPNGMDLGIGEKVVQTSKPKIWLFEIWDCSDF